MIVYDKLWQTMKNKGITQYALINQYHVSAGQLSAWRYYGIYKGRGLSLFFFCKRVPKLLSIDTTEKIAYNQAL